METTKNKLKYYTVKLSFHSPVRFGLRGLDLSQADFRMSSDGLVGALLFAAYNIYNSKSYEKFLNKIGSGELLFTSTFPFVGETYFFPRPQISLLKQDLYLLIQNDRTTTKLLKKVRYLPQKYFLKILNNEQLRNKEEVEEILDASEKILKNIQQRTINRNQIDTYSNKSKDLYVLSVYDFSYKAGLWFSFRGERELVEPLLRFLQDTGLGSDRTTGLGHFSFKILPGFPIEIETETKEAKFAINLSLVIPSLEDKKAIKSNLSSSRWQLAIRGGYTYKNVFEQGYVFLPHYWGLSEGSVLPKEVVGKCLELDESLSLIVYGHNFKLAYRGAF